MEAHPLRAGLNLSYKVSSKLRDAKQYLEAAYVSGKVVLTEKRTKVGSGIAASKDDHKYVGLIETLTGKPIPLVRVIDGKVIDTDTCTVAGAEKNVGKKVKGKARDGEPIRQGQAKAINMSNGENLAKLGNRKSAAKKSKPSAKIKNRGRDDELPSPPDCSGNTLAETGHVPAFLSR